MMKTNQEIIEYCKVIIAVNRFNYFQKSKGKLAKECIELRRQEADKSEAYQDIINFIQEEGEHEQNT